MWHGSRRALTGPRGGSTRRTTAKRCSSSSAPRSAGPVSPQPELRTDRPPQGELGALRAVAAGHEPREPLTVEPALFVGRLHCQQRLAVQLGELPGDPGVGTEADLVAAGTDLVRE